MRIVHCRREPYDVYIGRPSKWGNSYSHLPNSSAKFYCLDRQTAIELYERDLRANERLLADLPEIAGKTLGCWCAPQPCHGEVLIRLCRERGLIDA